MQMDNARFYGGDPFDQGLCGRNGSQAMIVEDPGRNGMQPFIIHASDTDQLRIAWIRPATVGDIAVPAVLQDQIADLLRNFPMGAPIGGNIDLK